MVCEKCHADQLDVYDSRPQPDNTIKRKRRCLACGHKMATIEVIAGRIFPRGRPSNNKANTASNCK